MIEDLLPIEVASVALRHDQLSVYLFPEEAFYIAGAVESRIREFATARFCARQALCKLGLPVSAIPSGSKREPLWPAGVVGSITHCRGYRAAAVALQQDVVTIGIDAEIHDKLPPEVLEQVASKERCWLTQAPKGIHWDRVLFSAKESVYKAWFPITGRWLGFDDVIMTFEPNRNIFHGKLLSDLFRVEDRIVTSFSGRFLVRDGLVLTAVAMLRRTTVCSLGG